MQKQVSKQNQYLTSLQTEYASTCENLHCTEIGTDLPQNF
ncbi:hypothetical protein THICB6_230112 [Thiomonas arsenitoxydans]|uniref:Uncharacterized protein n=1 Tax=Thiomonas delicata TaxID=364030 RepID=A0A238D3G8_THIDL|nr:hypothetical protein THICB6_230112 [Thiomonas arsenitoxydans]SBP87785.1 hypothetical protein THIARS_60498 [Thiomonas delicata]